MPRSWYDYHANALPPVPTDEQIADREFNLRILADRKPYFMQYIYPTLRKEYKAYMKSVETKCVREFRISLKEMLAIQEEELTEDQKQFIAYYRRRLPVSDNNCVMNRICRRFEEIFDGKMKQWTEEPFDYTIMKSGAEYTPAQYAQVKKIYEKHGEWLAEICRQILLGRTSDENANDPKLWQQWFRRESMAVCNNEDVLCDIVLDMCYRKSGSKEFAWDICAHKITTNLARRNDNTITFPSRDPDGDIEYAGMRFSMKTATLSLEDMEDTAIEGNSPEREGMGEGGN